MQVKESSAKRIERETDEEVEATFPESVSLFFRQNSHVRHARKPLYSVHHMKKRERKGREKKYKKISSLLQNQKPLLFFLRIHLRQNWISYATHVPSASFVIRLQGTSYYTMYTRRRNRKRPKRDLHETGMRDPASQTIPGEDGHPLESREDEERTRREKKGHTKYFLKNEEDQIPVFVKKEKNTEIPCLKNSMYFHAISISFFIIISRL